MKGTDEFQMYMDWIDGVEDIIESNFRDYDIQCKTDMKKKDSTVMNFAVGGKSVGVVTFNHVSPELMRVYFDEKILFDLHEISIDSMFSTVGAIEEHIKCVLDSDDITAETRSHNIYQGKCNLRQTIHRLLEIVSGLDSDPEKDEVLRQLMDIVK